MWQAYVCMLQTKLELLHACPAYLFVMDCSPAGSSLYRSMLARLCWQLTGVSCHFLLQGILLLQGPNLCLLGLWHWQVNSLPLSHLGIPELVYILLNWLFYYCEILSFSLEMLFVQCLILICFILIVFMCHNFLHSLI